MPITTSDNQNNPLSPIPATLLITVWARALASSKKYRLVDDPFATEIFREQPQSFASLESQSRWFKKMMALGVGIRTRCFDHAVSAFLKKHPEGLVLNVGCGLDARSHRLDNGRATWVDVDVAESILLREEYLPSSPRHHSLKGSLLSPEKWLDSVPWNQTQAVFLTVEGTFMYFAESDIQGFMEQLISKFPNLQGYIELLGDLAKNKVHPSVKAVGSNAAFRSGFRSPADAFEEMHPQLKVHSYQSLFEFERKKWGIFRWATALLPSLHDRLGSVLIEFSLKGEIKS